MMLLVLRVPARRCGSMALNFCGLLLDEAVNIAPFLDYYLVRRGLSTNSLLVTAGPTMIPSGWSVRFVRLPS
jgi:hypothetical protein